MYLVISILERLNVILSVKRARIITSISIVTIVFKNTALLTHLNHIFSLHSKGLLPCFLAKNSNILGTYAQ